MLGVHGHKDPRAGSARRKVLSPFHIAAVLASLGMLWGQFNAGELPWLSCNRSQVFDCPVHASGDIYQVPDLDIVQRRHE